MSDAQVQSDYHLRLHVCHRCEYHNKRGICLLDNRDIREQCEQGTCPVGKFEGVSRDYLRGAIGIAKWAAGQDQADKKTIAKRRVICRGCPAAKLVLGVLAQCGECKCVLMAKTSLRDQKCPQGKW